MDLKWEETTHSRAVYTRSSGTLAPAAKAKTSFFRGARAALLLTLLTTHSAAPADDVSPGANSGPYRAIPGAARTLRYHPDGADFVVTNGPGRFNRPLYGPNTAFRVDAGDRPEFSLYLPGRGGNLRIGLVTKAGTKWLDAAATIEARYGAGRMRYRISDPLLGLGRALLLEVVTATDAERLLVRATMQGSGGSAAPVGAELVFVFGGLDGVRGKRGGDIGAESEPVSRLFRMRPERCEGNRFTVTEDGFRLTGKPAGITILGSTMPRVRWSVADAAGWETGALLTASTPDTPPERPVGIARLPLPSEGKPALLALSVARGEGETSAAITPDTLSHAFAEAVARRAAVASRVQVETPDPFIDAAAAALCVAAEGIWDEKQGGVMHGAVAWRTRLLGWRGVYANDALGRHDRTRRHFAGWFPGQNAEPVPASLPAPEASANLSRNETALHSNGDLTDAHYDMNLVAIDALFRHLLWTGDREYARQVWPVIERHLAWERRLFRRPFGSDGLPLYEAYACIWASDDIGYNGGGTTYASAYNLYENRKAARVARWIGKDPAPYEREATLIQKAMRRELWLPERGWYAEWKDLLGLQLVHPDAGLWTFYHTVDSEVVTPFEAWQMARFVDTQLAHLPLHGPGVPSEECFTLATTNWSPPAWSTNNVVLAESAHGALAYWQVGDREQAFRLFKGCVLDSMYLGECPGNVGMCTPLDTLRGEAQRDFADGCGALSRALVEGLFGVRPDALNGVLTLEPGFPATWDHARLNHPDLAFTFRRTGNTDTYQITPRFPRPMALRLRIPARQEHIVRVLLDGVLVPHPAALCRAGVGAPYLEITAAPGKAHEVRVEWSGRGVVPGPVSESVAARGQGFRMDLSPATVQEISDPQGALRGVRLQGSVLQAQRVSGAFGHRTVFARVRQGDMVWWRPIRFEVRPAVEIVAALEERQEPGAVRFTVRNNTRSPLRGRARVTVNGTPATEVTLDIATGGVSGMLTATRGVVPGANRVSVALNGGVVCRGMVTEWRVPATPGAMAPVYAPVDLSRHFNSRLNRIFRNEYLSPRSPYCSLAVPKQGYGTWCRPDAVFTVDDAGLRAASAANGGQVLLPEGSGGVPFCTPGPTESDNALFVSRWDNYPPKVTVSLTGQASHAYLLMAGSTSPMQSKFDNGEVVVTYTDGSTERLPLCNPETWWPIDQDYRVDDFAFRIGAALPPRLDLATGRFRLLDRHDPSLTGAKGKSIPGGAATVLDLPLDPSKELRSVTVRALANEVVIGLLSLTLRRP